MFDFIYGGGNEQTRQVVESPVYTLFEKAHVIPQTKYFRTPFHILEGRGRNEQASFQKVTILETFITFSVLPHQPKPSDVKSNINLVYANLKIM